MNKKPIGIIDLFCGTGAFAQGFLNSSDRYTLLYSNDINKWAIETVKANHPDTVVELGDIRSIDVFALHHQLKDKNIQLIIGGPPCQGFSSLRPNRSSKNEDIRNNLFLYFANFIDIFRPKFFVMENVVGLITHDKGNTLKRIEEKFSSIGYFFDWKILNAASFGVPQKRERLIMIGSKSKNSIQFPKPTHFFEGKVIGHRDKSRNLVTEDRSILALTVNDAISDLPALSRNETKNIFQSSPLNEYQSARRKNSSELTLHKATNHSDKMLEIMKYAGENISSIPGHLITSGFSSCYSRLDGNKPSTTITVKFTSPASSRCIHPEQNRAITAREAARIQSFDDNYIFKGPITEIASQIGNAVPPLLAEAIGNALVNNV